ncbi:MAG TPA: copper chaperone PCu(A)C [Mycobacteriales bacterium]|nr:copper chaperone PCu(A)C [Mycobacteriales bacterium]
MSRVLSRRTAPTVLALALGLTLSGCGAGFEAQTYQQRSVGDGTNAAVGAIALRNVQLEPADDDGLHSTGDDVDVRLTLVNDGGEDDRLVEVTSPAGASVQILEEDSEVDGVDLPALGTTGTLVSLRLEGLTEELRIGEYVELTFRFERNGSLTVQAPVATTNEYDYERERSDNFHPPGSEHEGGEGPISEGGSLDDAAEAQTGQS